MKKYTKVALAALIAVHAGILGFSATVNVATTKCDQKLAQAQNIQCGNVNAPLTINNQGGGNVFFGNTTCYVTAGMSANQTANCIAIAGK